MTDLATKKDTNNFPAMLKMFLPEIKRALPKHMDGDRMARIALTAFRQTPKLAECDPRSVFAAVIQSAQLGLEVGLMGEAHLVPFKTTCQLIPGYQGLIKLARNSGFINDIYAHEVRANDMFDVVYGLDRKLVHEPLKHKGFPASDEERGPIVGFYAVAVFKDGSRTFYPMSIAQVEKIRNESRGYQAAKKYKKESPWDTHFDEMGKKTVIRALCKLLPKNAELATALALDHAAEDGADQNLTVGNVIEGTWAPPESEAPGAEEATTQSTNDLKSRLNAAKEAEQSSTSFTEAIAAVKRGDLDVARDLKSSMTEGERANIDVIIKNHEAVKQ